jgi:hypothetical protein
MEQDHVKKASRVKRRRSRRSRSSASETLDDVEAEVEPGTSPALSTSNADFKRPYRYHRLNGVDEVRLLIISPGSFNNPLHGEITTANLSRIDRPAYDALSYTWADETGDDERSSEILCDDDHSIIRITRNCEAAIRRLRLEKERRWIWIDAICIDQSSTTERTYQVSLMSKIYMAARGVVVYTGEGTPHTDLLFDWLNGLKTEDLDILLKWDLDNLAVDTVISFEKYLNIGKERLLALFNKTTENKVEISQAQLFNYSQEFFARRWFKRVWVLQEVSLPDVRNTTVVCGTKSTTAIRALHALSLIYKDQSGTMIRIFVLLRKKAKVKKSHLLDVLIETRDREAGDPRDKIFGFLSIANYLDKVMYPDLKAEYKLSTMEVYEYYSTFFIQHHGPGFFLSLIKSPSSLESLASWAADWTVPWPNYKAVGGRDFAAGSRPSNVKDGDAVFSTEGGCRILTLLRPKILRGYITRNGHIDGEKDVRIEGVDCLEDNEVLIEMYPGLAALLKKEKDTEYHIFCQVCPHALSGSGVEDLVGRWSSVVIDGESPKDLGPSVYLGPVEPIKIR